MVRVISASNLGWGDFGGSMSDPEVDGIVWERDEPLKVSSKTSPKPLRMPPSKLLGKVISGPKKDS